MAHPYPRRTETPGRSYAPVSTQGPLSPTNPGSGRSYFGAEQQRQPQHPPRWSNIHAQGPRPVQQGRGITTEMAKGAIGGAYGPYAYHPAAKGPTHGSRFSNAPSEVTSSAVEKQGQLPTSETVPAYMWDAKDPDMDDALHTPDPAGHRSSDSWTLWSARGWINAAALFAIFIGILMLFAGYPIISYVTRRAMSNNGGFNLGGANGTGQIPSLNTPNLIDKDTDSSFYTRTGFDGKKYNLVFSDEFNLDGRTFWPGDDPFWEAADLNYWPTGDLEWYDPQAAKTKDGALVLTMTEQKTHDLNFQSGMVTSWNKLCFTTGYIEVSISMPGRPDAPGLWPGAWTMGNLGRAGYGATNEGTWPFSYDACDVGTFPNQTRKDGTPASAATGGFGGPLSFLPGQKLSACTCPGSDHPGPDVSKGRNTPEIDIIETEIDVSIMRGQISQSYQTAPFNIDYTIDNSTVTIRDPLETRQNTYTGGIWQQSVSALSYINNDDYEKTQGTFAPYGFEWWSNPKKRSEGYITWTNNGKESWNLPAGAIGADPVAEISERLISEEPHYIILNLGMSPSFQKQDFKNMKFPAEMRIDWVHVYQREGVKEGLTCNPSSHPTTDYINNHINAYTNPNLTTFAQAGYAFPRNSMYDGC